MFILHANKNKLSVRQRETVTSGSVNVYRAQFQFSPDWDGLIRTAVFRADGKTYPVQLDESNICVVPKQALAKPLLPLEVGIYGTQGEDTVLTTVWASLGTILPGAAPMESTQSPDPWEQLESKGDTLAYDGSNLSLMAGEKPLSTVQISDGDPGAKIVRLNGSDYGLDVYSLYMQMTASGENSAEFRGSFSSLFSDFNEAIRAGNIVEFETDMAGGNVYLAKPSGVSLDGTGHAFWIDFNLTAYLEGVGWLSATIGLNNDIVRIVNRAI